MTDDQLAELYRTQKSLSEWLVDIKHSDVASFRKEDNEKRERLKILHKVIGLPFDTPTQFRAVELRDDNARFAQFLAARGDEPCGIKLIPTEDNLPKLRIRGKTIRGAYEWFKEQRIDPEAYRVDLVRHAAEYRWTAVFVVNKHGIQGEIIHGGLYQITQGFHDTVAPTIFRYDFKTWSLTPNDDATLKHLKKLASLIYVPDHKKQSELSRLLNATFTNDYLMGYFETSDSSMGTQYIDYNRSLGEMYADTIIRTEPPKAKAIVTGQTGSSGKAQGRVCIVDPDNLDLDFPENGILVCEVTTPHYVHLMQKASAIVTDQGGILSHAAIIARELHKPCIVGTGSATRELKNMGMVLVDADAGTVV